MSKLSFAAVPVILAALATTATAEPARRPAIELGGGIDFSLLGSYDLGEALGGDAQRSDLGPGTLGMFVVADIPVSDTATIGGEGGIAVGGLVKTDERYFGMRSDVGSTLTVWARARLGLQLAPRLRAGATAGIERLSEASGPGSVRIDALVLGPAAAVSLGRGFAAELHVDLHIPYRGNIGDDRRGDPAGTFLGAGIRLAYAHGIGSR